MADARDKTPLRSFRKRASRLTGVHNAFSPSPRRAPPDEAAIRERASTFERDNDADDDDDEEEEDEAPSTPRAAAAPPPSPWRRLLAWVWALVAAVLAALRFTPRTEALAAPGPVPATPPRQAPATPPRSKATPPRSKAPPPQPKAPPPRAPSPKKASARASLRGTTLSRRVQSRSRGSIAPKAEAPAVVDEFAGVPEEHRKGVEALAAALTDDVRREGAAGLSEPLMLLRFLVARGDVKQAAAMWRATHAWRREHVPRALRECGRFADPAHGPLDGAARGPAAVWTWSRHARPEAAATTRGRCANTHGSSSIHKHVIATDGGIVTVSRMGRFDIAGLARERALETMQLFQVSMLEDVLQTVRAASNRAGRLIRAHVIFDLLHLSILSTLAHVRYVAPPIAHVAQAYYPEINSSTTVVNSPMGIESIWKFVSLLLDDNMRKKVLFVGHRFAAALRDHALLGAAAVALLPASLGGEAGERGLMPCHPFPKGFRKTLEGCGEPPFATKMPAEATYL